MRALLGLALFLLSCVRPGGVGPAGAPVRVSASGPASLPASSPASGPAVVPGPASASGAGARKPGLQGDTMLHPVDSFTAYTLKKGEFVWNQVLAALPLPSWMWWGITDNLTMEIDLLPLVGGLFVDPHLPVPSVNFRYKLAEHVGRRPAFAYEVMFQRMWNPFRGQLNEENTVLIEREKASVFSRINMSQLLAENLRLHASVGVTWAQSILIENQNRPTRIGTQHLDLVSPDASLSLDWRPSPRVSLHLTGSYGTTFVYLDNVPRKTEIAYGFRLAPFYRSPRAILRNFRAEAAGLFFYFQDAQEWLSIPVPLFPYVYWQWGGEKEEARR